MQRIYSRFERNTNTSSVLGVRITIAIRTRRSAPDGSSGSDVPVQRHVKGKNTNIPNISVIFTNLKTRLQYESAVDATQMKNHSNGTDHSSMI